PLAVGAGGRLQREAVDADDLAEGAFQEPHQLQRPLDGVLVLVGMDDGEAREAGGLLVGDRVVLHGAAAERVELFADRIVHGREAAVVAHDLGLAEAREGWLALAAKRLGERGPRPDAGGRQAGRRELGAALLEAQALGHRTAPAVFAARARTSATR